MERNDIQKISSETANIPVYKQSAEYAIEHDELPAYRESFRVNMACRDALESAIHESYHDYCLDTGKAAAQVAAQFGMERVAYAKPNPTPINCINQARSWPTQSANFNVQSASNLAFSVLLFSLSNRALMTCSME